MLKQYGIKLTEKQANNRLPFLTRCLEETLYREHLTQIKKKKKCVYISKCSIEQNREKLSGDKNEERQIQKSEL